MRIYLLQIKYYLIFLNLFIKKHVASTSSKITGVVVLKITGSRSNLPTFFIHFEIELENSIVKCNWIIKKKLLNKHKRSKNLKTLIKFILNSNLKFKLFNVIAFFFKPKKSPFLLFFELLISRIAEMNTDHWRPGIGRALINGLVWL